MAKVSLTQQANRKRVGVLYERLAAEYPEATCTLNHADPLQLLIATILAAQCTDERVNIVTKTLFKKYKRPEDFVNAPIERLQEDIRSCGFYRQKAKSIVKTCSALIENFDGKVPDTMEALTSLSGVGRKTANVLLGECFNTPGIIVDTHCTRLSRRLGLTKSTDPGRIEQDLMKIVEESHWTLFSHYLVFHGRAVCSARSPRCSQCCIADLCPFPDSREGKKIAT